MVSWTTLSIIQLSIVQILIVRIEIDICRAGISVSLLFKIITKSKMLIMSHFIYTTTLANYNNCIYIYFLRFQLIYMRYESELDSQLFCVEDPAQNFAGLYYDIISSNMRAILPKCISYSLSAINNNFNS